MVDQITASRECSVCGATLNNDEFDASGICYRCAGYGLSQTSVAPTATAAQVPDPDNPQWGSAAGISVWLSSVAAIILVPVLAVIAWYVLQLARHVPVPDLGAKDEMFEWLKSPNLLLLQVLSTIVAHALTLVICWAVVTRLGKRPFWESLGWSWAGHSVWYWVAFSACVIVALVTVDQGLVKILPQNEQNSFSELIKSSQRVRVAIAFLATFSAPIVEEAVYRGVLFAAFRRHGLVPAVVLITLLFAGVHVPQYWGAWVSVAGLMMLSFVLTLIRARTKSILPCVIVHTLNNAFFSVLILLNKSS